MESDFTLTVDDREPARWTFPVGQARSIGALVNGVDAVTVDPGGATAGALIHAPAGDAPVRLRLRRFVIPRHEDGGESIRLPINPAVSARVEVGPHPLGLTAEVSDARGRIEPGGGDAGPAGALGPVGRLEVRWTTAGDERPRDPSGSVEALFLWDALASGDRVRARLTYRNTEGTPVVRLSLGPGEVVRDYQIPGLVDVSLEGTPERPEWVARVDPPLPDGATASVDVWRPIEEPAPIPDDGTTTRVMPRVEPVGVERCGGSLAFRRPAEWSGRIAPGAGAEALGEELFVRSWGTLPEESLTLSGAARVPAWLGRNGLPAVETGPRPARTLVTPAVTLTPAAGRIDVALDAEIQETGRPTHGVSFTVPAGLRLDRVLADGRTYWERTAPGSVTLRFDGPTLRSRKVRVRGWLPAGGDPTAAPFPAREIDVPWPRWPGILEQSGALTVVSTTRFQVLGAEGATAVVRPDENGWSPTPGAPFRAAYQVEPLARFGTLRWEAEPPRVAVALRAPSQLTIEPETADWVADLRYEIAGGPLDEINLRLPTEWARHASVWLEGIGHRRVTEEGAESTSWAIRPERPVWGEQRVVVRSNVPFPGGSSRPFPELKPRGWGESDTLVPAYRRERDRPPARFGGQGRPR